MSAVGWSIKASALEAMLDDRSDAISPLKTARGWGLWHAETRADWYYAAAPIADTLRIVALASGSLQDINEY